MNFDELKSINCEEIENRLLSDEEINEIKSKMDKWDITEDNSLYTQFEMENFQAALEFANVVGEIAEKENHHPDILIFGLKNVGLNLYTHDIEGISLRDISLALKLDELFD